MLTVQIINLTQDAAAPVADYGYVVKVKGQTVAYGTIVKHERAQGWQALLRRVAEHQEQGGIQVPGGVSLR